MSAKCDAGASRARKPYEEISATFNGNEVKIRVPKTCKKDPELTPSQLRMQQQCTCHLGEPPCPETCGLPAECGGWGAPGGGGGGGCPGCGAGGAAGHAPSGPTEQIYLQIPDELCEALTGNTRRPGNSGMTYSKTRGPDTTYDVTPGDAPRGVRAQKRLYPDKDVFMLKIGKQTDEPARTGEIEVELVTPRAPARPPPAAHHCRQVQCEEEMLPCYAMPCPRAVPPAQKSRRCCR
ncbi:hypothetical protein EVAR_68416_1 [Eumeta japonica]|uniref:Uncharacterized protein n=1 Tax=Eumeta variegata TaxID=151549 RepID=A0A4C1ZVD6_EUMVA|nr:hypothetical protein EVAR_68416_1 [Eumeta japonica]